MNRKLVAEAVGTFALVFAGTGAIVVNDLSGGSISQSFALEVVLSFLLMFVILGVSTGAKEKGNIAAPVAGAALAVQACRAVREPGCCT